MSCEIPHQEGNEIFFIKMWKPHSSRPVLKTLRGSLRESPKKTISTRGGLGPLQMVLEPDTERCVSENTEPRRGEGGLWDPTSIGERNEYQ